jgi:hypothetical protein
VEIVNSVCFEILFPSQINFFNNFFKLDNLANTCLYNSCPGGSVCTLQSNGYYSCQCPPGYYGPLCLSSSIKDKTKTQLYNY